jgi:hypothetical protein
MNSVQRYLTKDLVLIAIFVAVLGAIVEGCTPALHKAVSKGDISGVRDYLDKGADVNAKAQFGITPLIVAADKGHNEIVKLLIDRGADVNAKGKNLWEETPLSRAVFRGHTEIVKLLIDKGADVNALALCKSIRYGHDEIAKLLIERFEISEGTAVICVDSDRVMIRKADGVIHSSDYGTVELLAGIRSFEVFYLGITGTERSSIYEIGNQIPLVLNAESGHIYVVKHKIIVEPTMSKKVGRWNAWIEKYR